MSNLNLNFNKLLSIYLCKSLACPIENKLSLELFKKTVRLSTPIFVDIERLFQRKTMSWQKIRESSNVKKKKLLT